MVEERQVPELVITAEEDAIGAIEVLRAAVAEEAGYQVRFEGFPRIELKYDPSSSLLAFP